jgi:hypothetical protein
VYENSHHITVSSLRHNNVARHGNLLELRTPAHGVAFSPDGKCALTGAFGPGGRQAVSGGGFGRTWVSGDDFDLHVWALPEEKKP